jgi:DNA-binding NarL/FixJ family response regulator
MNEEATTTRTAVVIDPDPLWQHVMTWLLSKLEIRVVATAGEAEAAATLVARHRPELVTLEPGPSCDPRAVHSALRRAHSVHPDLTSIVVSARVDVPTVDAALAGGAATFVRKDADSKTIQDAVARSLAIDDDPQHQNGSNRAALAADVSQRLTRREVEILRLVAEGRSNHQVAQLLWVTDQTVKFHLGNVYRKLGVANRVEAARWAARHGLVAPDDNYQEEQGIAAAGRV